MAEFRVPLSIKHMQWLRMFVSKFRNECDWISDDGLDKLESSLKAAVHVAEVLEFKQVLVDAMPANHLDGEELDNAWDKFYETDWQIWFGDKLIVIPNGATIYNYITEFLDEYIQHEL